MNKLNEKSKAIYSELTPARDSAPWSTLRQTHRQAEDGKALEWKEGSFEWAPTGGHRPGKLCVGSQEASKASDVLGCI